MAYLKHFSLVLGAAVAASTVALPANAHHTPDHGGATVELAQNHLSTGETAPAAATESAEPAQAADAPMVEAADAAIAETLPVEATDTTQVGASEAPQFTGSEASLLLPEASTPANTGFNTADIDAILAANTVEVAPEAADSIDLAQSTAGAYGGIAPAYLGIGGNIGIVSEDGAVGDFGFSVLSKISLGPRFALRPSFIISEKDTSLTIPLTYNFNTASLGGFRIQPYVGAGVDIPFGSDVGILLDVGGDIPISRDFTVNTVANFRVSGGFAMGASIGVGYNFPFIFE